MESSKKHWSKKLKEENAKIKEDFNVLLKISLKLYDKLELTYEENIYLIKHKININILGDMEKIIWAGNSSIKNTKFNGIK